MRSSVANNTGGREEKGRLTSTYVQPSESQAVAPRGNASIVCCPPLVYLRWGSCSRFVWFSRLSLMACLAVSLDLMWGWCWKWRRERP